MNSTLRRVPRMVGIPAMMAVKFGAPEILHVVEAPAHRVETKTGGSAGGRCRSGSGLRVVLALLAEESPLPEFGQFGNAAAKDEMRLGSGAVHGFLLFFGSFVHDGVEIEVVHHVEGFFDQAASTESPGGSHDLGGESLFEFGRISAADRTHAQVPETQFCVSYTELHIVDRG